MLEHAALLSARCPSRAKGAAGFPSCDRGRKTSRPSRRCRIPLKQRCGGSPRRARRSGRRQSPPSQGTGPPTIWRSITGHSSRRVIAGAPSSHSTGRGIERPTPSAAITSSSSLWRKAPGQFVVFANGFVGAYKDPGRAAFRRTGLAEGPDGVLHVSDDVHGRIWRITYNGDGTDKVAPAQAPTVATTAPGLAMPPRGRILKPAEATPALPTPPGATVGQVALGDRIFHGEASDGTCSGCHGSDGGGSIIGPPLNSGHWLRATAASRGPLRRSRTASRIPSNFRA